MTTDPPVGARVRLRAPSWGLRLTRDTGTVIGLDRWDGDLDYVVVQLDAPALYDHGTGPPETLTVVVEMADNLELLG